MNANSDDTDDADKDYNPDEMPVAIRISWGLLGEWWCVARQGEPEVILSAIAAGKSGPRVGPDLIRDRLYGGFGCKYDQRRHVYYCTGQYTYLGANGPLDPESRAATWTELFGENHGPNAFFGGGLFCEDTPIAEEAPNANRPT